VVAKWTGELNQKQLTSVLNRDDWIEAQDPEAILDRQHEKMK
jgi:aerobic C4-dicarboxylate transport protein